MKITKLRVCIAAGLIAALALFTGPVSHAAIQLGGSIFPLAYISTPANNSVDEFNQLLALLNQQVAAFPPQNQGVAFSGFGGTSNLNTSVAVALPATTATNPLVQTAYVDVAGLGNFTSSIQNSGGYVFLQGVSGRKIVPTGTFTMYASGTTATATAIQVACQTSTNSLAKFPIGMLATGSVVSPFSSTGGTAGPTLGSALTTGCAASDGIILTYTGSAPTTTTDYFINFPYVVQ